LFVSPIEKRNDGLFLFLSDIFACGIAQDLARDIQHRQCYTLIFSMKGRTTALHGGSGFD
jgi:hypothetical protein